MSRPCDYGKCDPERCTDETCAESDYDISVDEIETLVDAPTNKPINKTLNLRQCSDKAAGKF